MTKFIEPHRSNIASLPIKRLRVLPAGIPARPPYTGRKGKDAAALGRRRSLCRTHAQVKDWTGVGQASKYRRSLAEPAAQHAQYTDLVVSNIRISSPFRFTPRYGRILRLLRSGHVGQVSALNQNGRARSFKTNGLIIEQRAAGLARSREL